MPEDASNTGQTESSDTTRDSNHKSAKEEIFFPDLAELWKEMYFKNENALGAAFKEFVSTETFVYMLDKILEQYLAFEKINRQNIDKYMEKSSLPSKKDIARVAELVISVEDKVEVLDFQMVQTVKSMADSLLSMVEAQNKVKEEVLTLRKDLLDLTKKMNQLNKQVDQLNKKTGAASKETTGKKSSSPTTKRKKPSADNEVIS